MTLITPGVYHGLSMSDYHGDSNSYSKSLIVAAEESLAKIPVIRQGVAPTEIMNLGTLMHKARLERNFFERDVAICDESILGKNGAKSTKAYKEWAAENCDKILCTPKEVELVNNALDRFKAPEYLDANAMFTSGDPEVSLFFDFGIEWNDFDGHWSWSEDLAEADSIIRLKTRPDWLRKDGWVIDYKTTAPKFMTPYQFARHAYDLKYHWSARLALWGLKILTGRDFKYLFVVQCNEPPHDIMTCYLGDDELDLAEYEMLPIISDIAVCHNDGIWPGSNYGIFQLEFPVWAFENKTNNLFRRMR